MIVNIVYVEIVKYVFVIGQVFCWVIIMIKNGFVVIGKLLCVVLFENDDEVIGKQIVLKNVENELWLLMGYVLKEKLS